MTEDRKELILDMQRLIDVNPRKEIFVALLANIAEDYAEKQTEKNKGMQKIRWTEKPKKEGSNVTSINGRINDVLLFEIVQFKNDMFEDEFILTSKVIPMKMEKDKNLSNLKVKAWSSYKKFIQKIS